MPFLKTITIIQLTSTQNIHIKKSHFHEEKNEKNSELNLDKVNNTKDNELSGKNKNSFFRALPYTT